MKKTVLFVLSLIVLLGVSDVRAAGDQFGGFKEFLDRGSLKPFTRDLGSILGAAAFHNGRSLGFSGFDLGIRGGFRFQPSKGNDVMHRKGVKKMGLPWVQAEIGLPFRLDGYIRGISYQGLTIAGGGLRYGLRKTDKPRTPQFLIATSAHSVAHRFFSASHFGVNFVGSISIKWLTPYLGAGIDRTRVVVRTVPVLDPTLEGESARTLESRFTVGVAVRPKPYLYLVTGYTLTHGQHGLDTGLGIRF